MFDAENPLDEMFSDLDAASASCWCAPSKAAGSPTQDPGPVMVRLIEAYSKEVGPADFRVEISIRLE